MKKTKELYRSKLHTRDKSHDVVIIQDITRVSGCKLKMTYECYNAVERFTGEQLVGGKWEFNFSMSDLGVSSDSSMYVSSEMKRDQRAESLMKRGIELFNILNS
jgi:hypothetical protein